MTGSQSRREDRGFALLITISLVAFLVLILLALATFTRVETQIASNTQHVAQARQNALLALNIALGQLQKYAGPDQRITATSDLAAFGANHDEWPSDASGQPENYASSASALVGPRDGTRRWTGVWGNADPAAAIYVQSPKPRLLNWLVSGNENAPVFGAVAGQITTVPDATAIPIKPDALAGDLAGATAMSNGVAFPGGRAAQLLVGGQTAVSEKNYVVAPLVEITSTVAPGLAGASRLGRYAWWVGDEGVKAKYNLADPYRDSPDTSTSEGRYRARVGQRFAVERMSGLDGYPVNADVLDKLLSLPQVAFADTTTTALELGERLHDITFHSLGLLADSQNGGLRRDLTHFLEKGGLTGKIIPPPPSSLDPFADWSLRYAEQRGPRWEYLRSYYGIGALAGGGSLVARRNDRLAITDTGTTQAGVFPVLHQLRVFFRLHVGADGRCFIRTQLLTVIGNPYNVPLVVNGFDVLCTNDGSQELELWIDNGGGTFVKKFNHPTCYPPGATGVVSPLYGNVFRHTGSFTLEPGALKVFSLAGVTSRDRFTPVATPLAPDVNLGAYVDQETGVVLTPAELTSPWRLRVSGGGALNIKFGEPGTGTSIGFVRQEAAAISYVGPNWTTTPTPFTGTPAMPFDHPWGGYLFAQRSTSTPTTSTFNRRLRVYADYNIRATILGRPWMHGASGVGYYDNPLYLSGYFADAATWTKNIAPPAWNQSLFDADHVQEKLVQFDVPRRASANEAVFLSLGALRHADFTADANNIPSAVQPGAALGNSLATPYVSRDRSAERRTINTRTGTVYDISYLINTALWDGWFFSTLPQAADASFTPGVTPLPNARLKFKAGTAPALSSLQANGTEVAGHLLIDGAFNVNSTSVQAWAALLGGLRTLALNNETNLSGPFPRSLHQPGGSADATDGESAAAYSGFRNLTDAQIFDDRGTAATADDTGLAVEIVREVRRRGPFVSLAHFVNRALVAAPSGSNPETDATRLGLKGALQAAIDNAGLNSGFPAAEDIGVASNINSYADPVASHGPSGTGLPGWLTQADVLEAIGPSLSARSDTFLIRTYGEVLDPVNSTPDAPVITGRAWCEAVVQRYPEYINPADASHVAPSHPDNLAFGRRFRVISFRWLNENDI